MPAYSWKAQPFLNAFANAMFKDSDFLPYVLDGTRHFSDYATGSVLHDEQRAVRWKRKPTKQPFWANYHCGKDTLCICRIDGSKGLESDAIFFVRSEVNRVLAIHLEFKRPSEPFEFGQAECYPLRAACFAATHAERKAVNAHDDWMTVLLCGNADRGKPGTSHFDRVLSHDDMRDHLPDYPS